MVCNLGILDHTVAFLNHLGMSRNFNQVIVLHIKFVIRPTSRNHRFGNVNYKAHFFVPLLNLARQSDSQHGGHGM